MEKILLFIKTYKPDFNQCKRLLDSITKHNKDGIKVLISVNDGDYDYFKNNIPTDFQVIKDSDIIQCDMVQSNPWQYQQIIKSQLHRIEITENYVCLDSDSYFIKDFYISDFMQEIFRLPLFISRKSFFRG